jgi:tetratricopeptide (TPR) repeat protein
MYDFSTSAGSKAPVTFLRALLQGLRAILASEPCILNDDINFESGSTCSELIVLVKPYLKAAIEEYTSFSILLSGTECLDPDTLQSILCVAPARPIPGLWICALLGTQDTKYSCKMQSIFFGALPCACMCAVVRSHIDNDAALVLIEECGIRHSSLETVLKKFRCHPNLCSLASFVSAISHSFANCCGSDTTQMFIQLAQSTPSSASFADILCDILVSMHSFDYGPNVFQYLMLCSRSRYGLQPSDLSSMSNVSSSVHMVCVEILRAIGACVGCFCIIPFAEVYLAIEKVLATSADPRNAIRLCDSMLSKFFSSMPMKWKVVENLIFVTESTGDFAAICRRLLECGVQHYIISNEYCVQDFRSFWQFFCQHPAGESISQRTRLSNHLSGITAISKNSCSSIVVAAKFCCLISLYETANSILTSFKGLYQSNLDDDPGKVASNDWSNLCIVFALQGRLNLAWGRLDAAESILKEALTAHGAAIDSDHVASDVSPNFDASRSVCGRLLSEIASILLVRSRTREALSFADKSVAFINGIESCRRSKFLSPSCVLDIMLCAMEARMANDLKSGAFSVIDSALNVCDSEFGKFHPRSLAVYERLCSLNCISDKRSDALVMYQRILKDLTIQRTWGFDVTGKLTTIILLISDILVSNHEMIEAVGLCEHALKFRIERYGSEPNLQVARCLEKLAACRMLSKDPKSASQDLKDALKIRQALSDSKKDQDYFMCVLQLSGALKAAGYRCAPLALFLCFKRLNANDTDRSEARQHLKEWVEHLKAELGDNHDFVHTALDIIHSRMND